MNYPHFVMDWSINLKVGQIHQKEYTALDQNTHTIAIVNPFKWADFEEHLSENMDSIVDTGKKATFYVLTLVTIIPS